MTHRAKALMLLLIAVGTCASQGLSMALCRCTGHVFVGAAPESCCGACPDEEASAFASSVVETSSATPGHQLLSRDNCFIVVSKGWETYLPANGKEQAQAPTPAPAAAEPLASLALTSLLPRYAPAGMMSWNLIHQPEPPGLSRVLLYRSLLI